MRNTVSRLYNNINETDTTLRAYKDYITIATLQLQLVSVQFAREIETVQDFLIKLGIKPQMRLLERNIFSINNDLVRLTKIMNNL